MTKNFIPYIILIRGTIVFRTYRFAAYRQFTLLVHNRIGGIVRRVIPSCVVSKIREIFPAPDGIYTGFKEEDAVNEIEITWIYRT